jgi:DeoR family fructose operon transcriptional repressor
MFREERRERILAALSRERAVRVADLGRALRASPASIRRDLTELERAGLLKRTHGGAVSRTVAALEPTLAEKEDRFQAEKAAIAAVAVSFVKEGETVCLDSGSTTRMIAAALRNHTSLTVVTNGLNIAWDLSSSRIEVILTGGQLRRGILSHVGPIAQRALGSLHVDKLFLAANGVDLEKGITTPNLVEAQTKQAMLNSASEIFLVVDHSKFGCVTFAHICPIERVHHVITDGRAPSATIRALEQRGVTVHVAAPPRAQSFRSPHGRTV